MSIATHTEGVHSTIHRKATSLDRKLLQMEQWAKAVEERSVKLSKANQQLRSALDKTGKVSKDSSLYDPWYRIGSSASMTCEEFVSEQNSQPSAEWLASPYLDRQSCVTIISIVVQLQSMGLINFLSAISLGVMPCAGLCNKNCTLSPPFFTGGASCPEESLPVSNNHSTKLAGLRPATAKSSKHRADAASGQS